MTGPVARFGDWLTAPARAERLALLRILVAGYGVVWLIVRSPHLRTVTEFADERWRAQGVLTGLDGPPSGLLVLTTVLVAVLSGLAVVVGWRHRITGPTFALALLLVTTWRNGWGQTFHTENLLVLHVMVLAIVPASAAWSLDARRSRVAPRSSDRFGWPIRVMALLTVSTYVVAGVAKLRYGGIDWLDGDVLAHQIAFDNVRKAAVGAVVSPIAEPLLGWRWLFTPMALSTLVVELGAPFALVSPRAARLWVGAAWLFHVGIVVTMVILFAYPLSLVALSPVLLAHGEEVPLPRVRRWIARRVGPRQSTGDAGDRAHAGSMTIDDDEGRGGDVIERARQLVAEASAITVLTGAGISTDSGIPDFRGPNGVWTKNPGAEKTATLSHYLSDPDVRRAAWQNRLRSPAWAAEPNDGHRALVELEVTSRLHTLVTQNIDELHQRAGSDPARVVEVHGTVRQVKCMACDERAPMERALDRVRAGEEDPACRTCGGILKSATISFGESLVVADIDRAERAALECDLLLAVGSSLTVSPVCNVVPAAHRAGAVVVIVNAEPTPFDDLAAVVVREPIGTALPHIVMPN